MRWERDTEPTWIGSKRVGDMVDHCYCSCDVDSIWLWKGM